MSQLEIINEFNENVMPTYGRVDLVIDKGEGRTCFDVDGNKYIDFGSGIGTNSLGYANDKWVEAVCDQAKKVQHTSNYYYTKVQADFAKKLCDISGYKNVFFGNSGAEANECAMKLARKYSFDKYGKGRHTIITLKNSFHGRSMATLTATGQDVFHNYFFPFLEGYKYVEANNIEDLEKNIDDTVCAIMIEFIQGEGGVVALEKDFVDKIFEIGSKKDILVIADEVQSGVGRTGKFLASELYNVKPDITTLAKGLGGGLPIGACLASEKCKDTLGKSMHGSTFGGNPIVLAGATVVLDTLSSNGFLDEVQKKSEYLRNKLKAINEVKDVTGKGLMVGVALKTKNAGEVLKKCKENGLLVLTAKEKVRLLPPLNITYEEIDEGIKILEKILGE